MFLLDLFPESMDLSTRSNSSILRDIQNSTTDIKHNLNNVTIRLSTRLQVYFIKVLHLGPRSGVSEPGGIFGTQGN